MVATAYSRVTVVNGSRRADLALPTALPLADVMPQLLRICGSDGGTAAEPSRWTIARIGGGALDLGQSLESAGVTDGDILELRSLHSPVRPAFVEDVRDVLEDVIDGSASCWSPSDTARWVGVILAVTAAVAAVPLQFGGPDRGWILGLRVAVAAILVGLTVAVERRAGAGPARLLAGTAVGWGALAGWEAARLAESPLPGLLALSASGALLVAVAGRLVTRVTEPVMVGTVAAGIAAGLAALGLLLGMTPVPIAALIAIGSVLVVGTLPRVALATGGVVAADYRIRTGRPVFTDDLRHRVSRSNGVLVGLATALGAIGLACTAVLAFATDPSARWLAVAIPLSQLLRSRAFSVVMQVAPLRLAGLAGFGMNAVSLYLETGPGTAPLLLAGVIAGAAVLALLGSAGLSQVSSARLKRLLNIAEWPVVVATVVLTAGATGLFDWVVSIAP